MWTLAHAHGTLLSLVHVLFGLSVRVAPDMGARSHPLISWCLIGASLLLPGGFFLAGAVFYGGDRGVGVLLVPVGAVSMMIAVFFLARMASTRSGESTRPGRRLASAKRGCARGQQQTTKPRWSFTGLPVFPVLANPRSNDRQSRGTCCAGRT